MRLCADTALSLALLALLSSVGECAWGFGSSDAGKVLLRDVQVLTLRAGHKTTGRRSAPVPQTKCVGGTADGQFTPQVVQCYNRGSDGDDVQWECKTDMDNAFRFGSVEVVCEGYDYPDDPYILKGSCGLEYTLDYTMEGNQRKNHDYYGAGQQSYGGNNYYDSYKKSSSGGFGDLILLLVAGGFVYFLYKTCISNGQQMGDRQYSSTSDDYPGGSPGGGGWFGGGHNNNQARNAGYGGYADNDAACGPNRQRGTGAGAGGGFWTGLATGGLMGYMFGNRGGGYGQQNYYGAQPRYGGGFGGGWGTASFGGGSGGGGGSSGSTGTRTASGFGGTRRR